MKKIISVFLVAVIVLSCAPCALAQDFDPNDEPKNEFALGYGAISNSNVLDVFTDVVSAIFGARFNNKKFLGPFSAEYFYHVSPLVGVGGITVFNHHAQDVLQNEQVTGKRTSNYFTILPAVKFNWLRKHKWGMYSKVGLGYTRAEYKTTGKGKQCLTVVVRNSFGTAPTRNENGFFNSTKHAGEGVGTSSVESIARKYSGTCSFKPESGVFTVSVILYE